MTKWLTILVMILATLDCVAQQADDDYPLVVRDAMRAMQKDSLEKADSLIHKAIRIRPADMGNAVLYQYLGEIRMRQKRQDEALEAFNIGLGMLPSSQSLLLDRASLYIYRNENERALHDLNDLLTLNPDEKQGLFYRAYIYDHQHLYRKARLDYEHLLRIDPENREARVGLAVLNAADSRPQEAMDQIEVVIRFWPQYATGYAVRGGFYQKRRDYQRALQDMNKALELEPRNPDFYVSRAMLYKAFKKDKLCREDLRMAVQLGADAQECATLLLDDSKQSSKKKK